MAKRKIESMNGYTFEKVFLSVEDHIAVMTLHNPPVNAASGIVQEEILKLCDYINHDDDIWVCIMHSDIKTFCVGVDINRFYQSILDKDVTNVQEVYYDGAQALYELRVPLICAVHGHCLGGGLCYPAGADISIAVRGTVFGSPEAKLSVVGGCGHLARLIPPMIRHLHHGGGAARQVRRRDPDRGYAGRADARRHGQGAGAVQTGPAGAAVSEGLHERAGGFPDPPQGRGGGHLYPLHGPARRFPRGRQRVSGKA